MNLPLGNYTISELSQPGWIQTFPPNNNAYHVTMIVSGFDTTGLDFGNHYAPRTLYPVSTGWNLLSLPFDVVNHIKDAIYPTALSQAFKYENGYKTFDTIPNGIGYWLKFGPGQNIPMGGNVRLNDTILVTGGWNIVGTLSLPVQIGTIQQLPDNNVTTNYYLYDGGYHPAVTTLDPHKGYWVRTKASGKLVFTTSVSKQYSPTPQSTMNLLNELNTITINDKAGSNQTLYFGKDENIGQYTQVFELPPTPPSGLFDARFSSGTMVATTPFNNDDAMITVQGAVYPLRISWNMKEKDEAYLLSVGMDGSIAQNLGLQTSGTITIESPKVNVFHLKQKRTITSERQLPKDFQLEPNYPNPFNPATTISYALPTEAVVKIQIFNLIGQQIAELVNKTQSAGRYTIVWDANSFAKMELPDGIYFYRLDAFPVNGSKPFSQMKKMTLLK